MIRVLVPGGILALSVPNESLIDRLKSLALGVRGYKRLFQSDAYASPVENEWHLHRFDKKLLKRLVAPWVELRDIRGIPFLFCPLRYVAFLEKPLDEEI